MAHRKILQNLQLPSPNFLERREASMPVKLLELFYGVAAYISKGMLNEGEDKKTQKLFSNQAELTHSILWGETTIRGVVMY